MTASWCSASIRFFFSSSTVRIRAGGATLRKDPWNGGTPMLAWSVHVANLGALSADFPVTFGVADAVPFQELLIFDQLEENMNAGGPSSRTCCIYRVEISLIDWASVFEIEAVIFDAVCDSLFFASKRLLLVF
jgi:hypothetical protein